MDNTKLIFRIIFKSLGFLALGFATYWLYTHPEHELHDAFIATAIWALMVGTDIADDLQPESRAPWKK